LRPSRFLPLLPSSLLLRLLLSSLLLRLLLPLQLRLSHPIFRRKPSAIYMYAKI
jgi:hypothetical protein